MIHTTENCAQLPINITYKHTSIQFFKFKLFISTLYYLILMTANAYIMLKTGMLEEFDALDVSIGTITWQTKKLFQWDGMFLKGI